MHGASILNPVVLQRAVRATWNAGLWPFGGLVALSMLGGCASSLSGPRERDVWHAFVADGQRYGYQHTVVKRLPDGNYEYRTEARLRLSVFGAPEEEITSTGEYVVTRELLPISFKAERHQATGDVRATGQARDGLLRVESERAGAKGSAGFELKDRPLFAVCIDDWLHARPRQPSPVNLLVLDEESYGATCPRTYTRLSEDATGSVWTFDSGVDAAGGTTRYDKLGVPIETTMTVPKLVLTRCTAEEAKNITCRPMTGRSVLMFPVGRSLGDLARLDWLTVKLTWEEIPFERFELEDARQHIISKSEENGNYEAVVRIAAPEAMPGPASYPIIGGEFAPYLAGDRYIQPDNPRVVTAARTAVEGQATALDAVRALAAWVFKYMQGGMPAETLSAAEIMECRQGKCTEYAILFASLARAVGIPTRMVLGDRNMGLAWGGHMWNEAYVGEWITVDASANEVGASLSLLKFLHSDSFFGTQPLRWALTDSLNITVEDFAVRPSPLAQKYKTGLVAGEVGSVYTNVDHACRLTTPTNAWTAEENYQPGLATVRFHFPGDEGVRLNFVAFALPLPGIEPKHLTDGHLNKFQKFDDFELQKNEACAVGADTGHTLRFAYTEPIPDSAQRRRMLNTEVIWIHGSSGYVLSLIAEADAHDQHLADLQKLLADFQTLAE